MTDLNRVVLIGRLTRDAELVNVGQTVKADLSIAVNRSRKQTDGSWTDEVSFFDFTLWGKTAEGLKPFLTKGKQIAIEGHLKQDRWEKDGQKFSKVSIVAENVQLLGGRSENGNSSAPASAAPDTGFLPAAPDAGFSGGEVNQPFTEDIPF